MFEKHIIFTYLTLLKITLLLLALIISTIVAIWYFSDQKLVMHDEQLKALKVQNVQIYQQNTLLQKKNLSLQTALQNQQKSNEMQKSTNKQLQQDLSKLQTQIIALNKNLMFYKNITQGSSSVGIKVAGLQLTPINHSHSEYIYRIILKQGEYVHLVTQGEVKLSLETTVGKKIVTHLIDKHPLNIRLVQIIEGSIKLKDGEHPKALTVKLTEGKKKLTERNFDWDVALNSIKE